MVGVGVGDRPDHVDGRSHVDDIPIQRSGDGHDRRPSDPYDPAVCAGQPQFVHHGERQDVFSMGQHGGFGHDPAIGPRTAFEQHPVDIALQTRFKRRDVLLPVCCDTLYVDGQTKLDERGVVRGGQPARGGSVRRTHVQLDHHACRQSPRVPDRDCHGMAAFGECSTALGTAVGIRRGGQAHERTRRIALPGEDERRGGVLCIRHDDAPGDRLRRIGNRAIPRLFHDDRWRSVPGSTDAASRIGARAADDADVALRRSSVDVASRSRDSQNACGPQSRHALPPNRICFGHRASKPP